MRATPRRTGYQPAPTHSNRLLGGSRPGSRGRGQIERLAPTSRPRARGGCLRRWGPGDVQSSAGVRMAACVVVIGAGEVGVNVARTMSLDGHDVTIVEADPDVAAAAERVGRVGRGGQRCQPPSAAGGGRRARRPVRGGHPDRRGERDRGPGGAAARRGRRSRACATPTSSAPTSRSLTTSWGSTS